MDKLHIDTDLTATLAHNAAVVIWSKKMSLKKSLHTHSLKLNEPSPSALNPEMQWLRDQLLEGAASEPGEPFSKEYFRKLINRRIRLYSRARGRSRSSIELSENWFNQAL